MTGVSSGRGGRPVLRYPPSSIQPTCESRDKQGKERLPGHALNYHKPCNATTKKNTKHHEPKDVSLVPFPRSVPSLSQLQRTDQRQQRCQCGRYKTPTPTAALPHFGTETGHRCKGDAGAPPITCPRHRWGRKVQAKAKEESQCRCLPPCIRPPLR